ncbi:MAG: hypothetical protein K0S32_4563 [Bacteroidetes bacterium]|nr:hypothetical protein [Bacteroidota bacterium]
MDDFHESMVVDKWGNAYTTGYFFAGADFDPGPGVITLTASGGADVFITKSNPSGNLVWAAHIGGPGNEFVSKICQDTAQNIYITGWFNGITDFNPGPGTYTMGSSGIFDAYVCKLDANGNFLWAKQFSGNGEIYGGDVSCDSLGCVYVTGRFTLTGDFDPGAATFNMASAGNGDAYICKLNSSGNFIWAKRVGQSGNDGGGSLLCSGNSFYLSGWYTNTCDLDAGAGNFFVTSNGGNDIFISKFDTSGTFMWGGSVGGTLLDVSQDMALDSVGNLYVTGFFEGTADFNPGASGYSLTSAGSEDIFVLKINPSGTFVWAKAMGGASQDNGRGIVVGKGSVYTTGVFSDICDFDPSDEYEYNLPSSGNVDIFISQLDMHGNFVCAAAMGGPGSDVGDEIGIDASGFIYINGDYSGYTSLAADFDPGPGSFTMTSTDSTYDIFLAKYTACMINVGLAPQRKFSNGLKVYPNPSAGKLTIEVPEVPVIIDVIDAWGKTVKKISSDNNITSIDISNEPSGVYVVKVVTKGITYTQKIFKE